MEQLLSFIEFNQYNLPFILSLFGLYILILWLAVVTWALKDITTRSHNFLVILFATILVAIGNLPGLIIYLLLRPDQTIEENSNRGLFHASVVDRHISACGDCGTLVRTSYKYCPNCSHELEESCKNCHKKVNPTWKYCAHCNEKLVMDPWYSNLRSTLKHKLGNIEIQRPKLNKPSLSKPSLPRPHIKLPKLKVKLPRLDLSRFRKVEKVSVIAAEKKVHEKRSAVVKKATKSAAAKSATKRNGKPRRGRPKGTSDAKPRKKRSDAGKKRGSYKK